MIEFGCGLERSCAFVRRMAIRNQLPLSQRTILLRHLVERKNDNDSEREGMQNKFGMPFVDDAAVDGTRKPASLDDSTPEVDPARPGSLRNAADNTNPTQQAGDISENMPEEDPVGNDSAVDNTDRTLQSEDAPTDQPTENKPEVDPAGNDSAADNTDTVQQSEDAPNEQPGDESDE